MRQAASQRQVRRRRQRTSGLRRQRPPRRRRQTRLLLHQHRHLNLLNLPRMRAAPLALDVAARADVCEWGRRYRVAIEVPELGATTDATDSAGRPARPAELSTVAVYRPTASTCPAFFKSNSVSGPRPGPISKTLSAAVSSAVAAMRSN